MASTLSDLDVDPKGNINLFSVDWTILNHYLSYLNSKDSVHHKIDDYISDDYIRKRLDRLNRGHVIKELEDRRLGNITHKSKLHDKLYVLAMRGRGRDIGAGKDWIKKVILI